jgi:hypothetical protein
LRWADLGRKTAYNQKNTHNDNQPNTHSFRLSASFTFPEKIASASFARFAEADQSPPFLLNFITVIVERKPQKEKHR